MKLLAISNPEFIPDEAEIINSLFRAGLVCLHIRKPESSEDDFRQLLSKIDPEFLDKVAVHQHHRMAEQMGIKRLHFTEQTRKTVSSETLESLVENDFILSTSVHNLKEIENLPDAFSYTFFGPVFDSISKLGYRSVLKEDFSLKNERNNIQIIALGGVERTNLEKVKEMDFDGAAMLGTLWNEPEKALQNFTNIKRLANQLQRDTFFHPGVHSRGIRKLPDNKFSAMIDKLQFISNQKQELTHLGSIRLALESGCKWIQLRVKDQPEEIVLQTASEAKALCEKFDAKLMINDFPLIAKAVDAYGLHLGLDDMPIKNARAIVGAKMIIGGTANTLDHILQRINEGADYVGLGPFRFTTTKQKLSPIVGLEGYTQIIKSLKKLGHNVPLIAIGGIMAEDIADILATGIFGVAMSGTIIDARNREKLVYEINKLLC